MGSTIKQRLRRYNGTDYDNIYLSANVEDVIGTLSVSNGGTGHDTLSSGYFLRGNGTGAVTQSSVDQVKSELGVGIPWTKIASIQSRNVAHTVNQNTFSTWSIDDVASALTPTVNPDKVINTYACLLLTFGVDALTVKFNNIAGTASLYSVDLELVVKNGSSIVGGTNSFLRFGTMGPSSQSTITLSANSAMLNTTYRWLMVPYIGTNTVQFASGSSTSYTMVNMTNSFTRYITASSDQTNNMPMRLERILRTNSPNLWQSKFECILADMHAWQSGTTKTIANINITYHADLYGLPYQIT